MKLTLLGGKGEIGGNKILVEDLGVRVFFDFGMSFKQMGMYYDDFLQPRKLNGMDDYITMGIAPDIKGLYREDFLEQCGRKKEKTAFDAVFLSHPHLDHCGLIPLIDHTIPFYCGEEAKVVLQALQETGEGFKVEYLDVKKHFTGLHYTKVPHFARNVHTFKSGETISIGKLKVTPVHVDHSVPGAYGFIIEGSERVVYTGDLRVHGWKPYTADFISAAKKKKVDKLIIEGTRIGSEKSHTEEEVLSKISSFMKETKGLVVVNYPPRDVDRLNTMYKAATKAGRKLVVNMKTAYLIELFSSTDVVVPPLKDLLIYIPRKFDGHYYPDEYDKWARKYLEYPNAVKASELEQRKVALFLDSFSFGELIDIEPIGGSCYIYSLCEPFNDEMELDHKRLMNWIDRFKLKYYQAHASGHASGEEIMKIIDEIQPKEVVWVHTEKK